MNVGRYLREQRQRAGLSQVQMAKITGYDQSYLSHVEMGDQLPSPELCKSIIEVVSNVLKLSAA